MIVLSVSRTHGPKSLELRSLVYFVNEWHALLAQYWNYSRLEMRAGPARRIQNGGLKFCRGLKHLLASVYRNTGNLDAAESLAMRAVAKVRELEDRYHLPEDLTLLADLKARKGDVEQADQLYSEVTDVIDALLVNLSTDQLKGSLISQLTFCEGPNVRIWRA